MLSTQGTGSERGFLGLGRTSSISQVDTGKIIEAELTSNVRKQQRCRRACWVSRMVSRLEGWDHEGCWQEGRLERQIGPMFEGS